MKMSETKVFDIFLSYKTRKYLALAVWLYERLTAAGYRVWFDRKVLEQKEITGREYTTKELIDVLTQAASHAKCSVILEAELELVLLLPGMTREYALTNLLAMEDDSGALINWNWQKLEIDSSDRSIAIYYSAHKVSAHRQDAETFTYEFSNDESLLVAVRACLTEFGI